MDSSEVKCPGAVDNLRQVLGEANRAMLNDEPLESYFLAVLQVIKSNIECRFDFARVLLSILRDSGPATLEAPWEVIPFCMHELRWPEVEHEIEQRLREALARNDWRAVPVLTHCRDAFSDDWESADLYEYYR